MKNWITILVVFVSNIGLNAQSLSNEVISSNGNHYENTSLEVSWSIGETVIATHQNSNLVITQGFHQPAPVTNDTIIDDTTKDGTNDRLLMNLSVYPNPSTDIVYVQLNDDLVANLQADLLDAKGSLVLSKKIISNRVELNVSNYSPGMYFLKILDTDKNVIKNFKIEKLK